MYLSYIYTDAYTTSHPVQAPANTYFNNRKINYFIFIVTYSLMRIAAIKSHIMGKILKTSSAFLKPFDLDFKFFFLNE